MEPSFEYNKYVFGSNFIGRNKELSSFCNLVREHNNILIYGPARIGKKSLIYNSLKKLEQENYSFTICNINLFNIRCIEAFLLKFTNELFTCLSRSAIEWVSLLKKYIPKAPYKINEEVNKLYLTYTSRNLLTEEQILEILQLPYKLSEEYRIHLLVYFEQFQDILLFDNSDKFFSLLKKGWNNQANANFIFTGERYNAMSEIFFKKKFFNKKIERIKIIPIEENIFVKYIERKFKNAGKFVQPELASIMYRIVEGDPWYLQHLSSICLDLTTDHLNKNIIEQGVNRLINLHNFQFNYVMHGLSKYQLRFLKAILNGVKKFSCAQVLYNYKLNSSANVNRIKNALTKKEIIAFDNKNEPYFLDPLFKYWLVKYFFVK